MVGRCLLYYWSAALAMTASLPTQVSAQQAGASSVRCTTDQDFLLNLRFVEDVCCDQLAEDCGKAWFPVGGCNHTLCADALHRVYGDCSTFLQGSRAMDLWGSQAKQLQQASERCQMGTPTMAQVAISSPITEAQKGADAREVNVKCAEVLVAGRGGNVANWDNTIVLTSKAGFGIELDFFAMWLGEFNRVDFFDGPKVADGSKNNLIRSVRGPFKLPANGTMTWAQGGPIRTSVIPGKLTTMTVHMIVDVKDQSETPVAFGAKVQCVSPCKDANAFSAHCNLVTGECCHESTERCSGGLPQNCNTGCADVIRQALSQCDSFLKTTPMMRTPLGNAVKVCPAEQVGDEAGLLVPEPEPTAPEPEPALDDSHGL